jgi:hypothetical protein
MFFAKYLGGLCGLILPQSSMKKYLPDIQYLIRRTQVVSERLLVRTATMMESKQKKEHCCSPTTLSLMLVF